MSRSETSAAVRIAWITVPDAALARRLARTLVEERLAACVNVLGDVRSIYRWEGKVEDDGEALLMVKTHPDRCAALQARVLEMHPYDVPEVLWLDVGEGHGPYLDWVRRESAP